MCHVQDDLKNIFFSEITIFSLIKIFRPPCFAKFLEYLVAEHSHKLGFTIDQPFIYPCLSIIIISIHIFILNYLCILHLIWLWSIRLINLQGYHKLVDSHLKYTYVWTTVIVWTIVHLNYNWHDVISCSSNQYITCSFELFF